MELYEHKPNPEKPDIQGDIYCKACWYLILREAPFIKGVPVAKAEERVPIAKTQKTTTQSQSSSAPADATSVGPSQSNAPAPADVTAPDEPSCPLP